MGSFGSWFGWMEQLQTSGLKKYFSFLIIHKIAWILAIKLLH